MSTPPFELLFEDNHLLAVNKAAGVLTQPTDIQTESLETLLKSWLKEKYQKPGNVFLGIIHRLDRPVSGIVIFAKTSKALSRLNDAMRNREMRKTYLAIVEGKPPQEHGTLEHYLRHDEFRAEICQKNSPEAKIARLHYKTLKSAAQTTLLEVILETGRYHQIRAQFAAIGCPVAGDAKYGSTLNIPGGAIALHHARMELIHPVTRETLIIKAPAPNPIKSHL